jgi:hypothetical protein
MTVADGHNPSGAEARMRHFHALDREQQAQAIRRLSSVGLGEHSIAQATGLSIEQVAQVLNEADSSVSADGPA